MIFRFIHTENINHSMIEHNSGTLITYNSKAEMIKRYPGDGYEVVGEIGNYASRYASQDEILAEQGKMIPIFPRGSSKPFEWITGYTAIVDHTYVAVIKSIIPHFLYKRKASMQLYISEACLISKPEV